MIGGVTTWPRDHVTTSALSHKQPRDSMPRHARRAARRQTNLDVFVVQLNASDCRYLWTEVPQRPPTDPPRGLYLFTCGRQSAELTMPWTAILTATRQRRLLATVSVRVRNNEPVSHRLLIDETNVRRRSRRGWAVVCGAGHCYLPAVNRCIWSVNVSY